MSAPSLFDDDFDLSVSSAPASPPVRTGVVDDERYADAGKALDTLRPYLSRQQWLALRDCMRGEEKEYFADKAIELAAVIENMPVTYAQDGKGADEVKVCLHYFLGDCHWFITEKDVEDGVSQAFGFAILHGDMICAELGYISISELVETGVEAEMDFYFAPVSLAQIRKQMEARYGS